MPDLPRQVGQELDCALGDEAVLAVVEKIADRACGIRISLRGVFEAAEDSAHCACGKGTLRCG